MAEGSRVVLRYIKETEYGITPIGKFNDVAFTATSFELKREKEKKKKILPRREYGGVTTKTQSTEGGFENPLQSKNIDDLLEGVLMSRWIDVTGGTGGGEIVAGATASNLDIVFTTETVAGAGGTIEFGSSIPIHIIKDQVIFITDTQNDGENDGSYIVKSVDDSVLTVNSPLVSATYETGCKIKGDMLRNDSKLVSYTFEEGFLDVSKYVQFVGQVLATLDIKFEPENDVELSFGYAGKSQDKSNVSVSVPAPDNSTDSPYFTCGDNVDGVFFDYELQYNCLVQALSFKIDNQTEPRKSIAVFGACNQRIKPIDITGSITLFFQDMENYDKYRNDVAFNLCVIIGDSVGNKYSITCPHTDYMTGKMEVSSMEDEVPEEHDFQGTSNGLFSIQICKTTN